LWLWSSLFTSLALYTPLFFWSLGVITVGNRFWKFKVHRRRVIDDPDGMRQEAFSMIMCATLPTLSQVCQTLITSSCCQLSNRLWIANRTAQHRAVDRIRTGKSWREDHPRSGISGSCGSDGLLFERDGQRWAPRRETSKSAAIDERNRRRL
jgi:hypothetical protein